MEKTTKLMLIGGAAAIGFTLFKQRAEQSRQTAIDADIIGSPYEPDTSENFITFARFPAGEPCNNWGTDIERWRGQVVPIADSYDVPPQLVMGLIWTESNGDAGAVGDNGRARGLMQISPDVWEQMGNSPATSAQNQPCVQCRSTIDNSGDVNQGTYCTRCASNNPIMQPEANLRAGIQYLAWIKRQPRVTTWRQALYAYNWGIGNFNNANGSENAIPQGVKTYAIKVLDRANRGSGSIFRPSRACCTPEQNWCGSGTQGV